MPSYPYVGCALKLCTWLPVARFSSRPFALKFILVCLEGLAHLLDACLKLQPGLRRPCNF